MNFWLILLIIFGAATVLWVLAMCLLAMCLGTAAGVAMGTIEMERERE